MPIKSEVGIFFDTLLDFEVHNYADVRIVDRLVEKPSGRGCL